MDLLWKNTTICVSKIIELVGTMTTTLLSNPLFQIVIGIIVFGIIINIIYNLIANIKFKKEVWNNYIDDEIARIQSTYYFSHHKHLSYDYVKNNFDSLAKKYLGY